jgi:hypothetical protein
MLQRNQRASSQDITTSYLPLIPAAIKGVRQIQIIQRKQTRKAISLKGIAATP